MGSIELKMAMLTGAVVGMLIIVVEGVAMHRKASKYRAHLRELYRTRKFIRLFMEAGGIAFVILVQPVIVSVLMVKAMDNLNPEFSVHAMAQLREGMHIGALKDNHHRDQP